ncbi:cytochrome P450 [Streptomyces mashuensis]|uniref:Cytochrome P450 n=1 Tax=Streptomyces mashuensis TaxID=33904 RepID=A0A919EDV9_9ACTN|nr:cytochrome P450 [Streptomyces mashuensis]GHF52353.1 cytochrome P450 [Streptomyces mashuensis]
MNGRSPRWTVGGPDLDLADPHFYTDPRHHGIWRAARDAHPVAWTESARTGGFWSVTTHAEGSAVLRNPQVFVSGLGMRLGADPRGVEAAAGRMLVVSDGAAHRRLRSAHQSWFNGRAVAALLPVLRRQVDARLGELLARGGPFDAVAELAEWMPTWVLFEMMDIPGPDRDELAGIMARAFDDADESAAGAAGRTAAHTEIFAYFAGLLDDRRDCPGRDIVSSLATAEAHGRPFTDDEVLLNCDGLMNGGLETTPHAVSGALLALARRPDAWRLLKQDPGLLDTAVEEVLRWTSPALHAMRTAAEDTTLGGARIRRGDRVVVWLPSCNHDERVFPDPDAFEIGRRPNPHLGFGGGPHYCVGSTLARAEVRCLLEALLRHVKSIEVTGDAPRRPSNFLRGLQRLEVELVPEAGNGRGAGADGEEDVHVHEAHEHVRATGDAAGDAA